VRIARFAKGDGVAYGVVDGPAAEGPAAVGSVTGDSAAEGSAAVATISELHGHPFGVDPGGVRLTGRVYPLVEVRLLAPVLPSKVIGAAAGSGGEPVLFLKPSTAVTGPGDAIRYPVKLAERVDCSGELAVVIGRLCRQVPRERADEVIFGYACAADVTARDLQARDGQWVRAKGFDTFCPLGPWMETGAPGAADLGITTTVNGAVRALVRTSELPWDVQGLISYVSNVMTLLPGDVLLTGAPGDAGTGPLSPGDEVTVEIESIGTLTNKVVIGD
jgi:hypothetical protein